MTKKRPLVVITWVDTTSFTTWQDDAAITEKEMATITTVGYLVATTRKDVRIVRSMASDGGIGDLMLIPKACVLKIKKVRS